MKTINVKVENKFSINYGNDAFWYKNTYDMLGSKWLFEALHKLNLKKDFSFLSPSANCGWYEREAYDSLRSEGYAPAFYVGDMASGELQNKAEASEKFIWISGEGIDAAKIQVAPRGKGTIPTYVDVILDCKGAIWHTINNDKKDLNQLIELLENYYNLLIEDNSVLLIDYDMPSLRRRIGTIYIEVYYTLRNIRRKKVKMQYMAEFTTAFYLYKYIGEKMTENAFKPMCLGFEKDGFKDNFDLAFCTKTNLRKYIDELKTVSNKLYRKNKKVYRSSNFRYAISTIIPIFLIVLGCLCEIVNVVKDAIKRLLIKM